MSDQNADDWRTLTMRRLSQASPDPLRAHGPRDNNSRDNNPRSSNPGDNAASDR